MSYTDKQFEEMMRAEHFMPDTAAIMYAGRQITAQTAIGDRFRQDMRAEAARAVGIPAWLSFSGEFDDDISEGLAENITEVLMARALNPSSPIRLGARLAVTGLGVINASAVGADGHLPMLIDEKVNLFGELAGVGVTNYDFIDNDLLSTGEVPADVIPENCVGVVAILKNPQICWAEDGQRKDEWLINSIVPLAVDELQFHKLG